MSCDAVQAPCFYKNVSIVYFKAKEYSIILRMNYLKNMKFIWYSSCTAVFHHFFVIVCNKPENKCNVSTNSCDELQYMWEIWAVVEMKLLYNSYLVSVLSRCLKKLNGSHHRVEGRNWWMLMSSVPSSCERSRRLTQKERDVTD